MPLDLPFEKTCATRPNNMKVWLLTVVVTSACFVVGFCYGSDAVRFALIVAGIILLAFLTSLVFQRGSGKLRRALLDATAIKLISQDTDHAFLSRGDGVVRYANPIATDRFGACQERMLSDVLGTILANPEPVLHRLQRNAKDIGVSKEDIVTRNGHFRLGLTLVGDDFCLWRLDDLGKMPAASGGGKSACR